MIRIIKVNPLDNVAIPVDDLPKGGIVAEGIAALEDIPQGHKIALRDLREGAELIRYGVSLGRLNTALPAGSWVREHMLELPDPPGLDEMPYAANIITKLPSLRPSAENDGYDTFEGYEVPGSLFAGTRNILGVMSSVQCVAGVLNAAVRKIKSEFLPKYPHVDDVVILNHAYGCGVAIKGREAGIPIRTLRNLIRNPNFGGELMVVGLGCEKLTVEMLLEEHENSEENVVILQNLEGFHGMINALMNMAEKKLRKLEARRRVSLPLERLCIGMQCGGSDTFSGITANPSAGYACDLLIASGGTALFSEVTEVRDGVRMLAARCADREVSAKLAGEMRWYDDYLEKGGVDRDANPSPGNKKGGLSNVMEKAMGSIAKSGSSPIVEILSPGERPSRRGLIFAATPASDFVCGPLQLAGGITLQVFMTGRGTPYGLAAAPVIKVSSRTKIKDIWNDLIDINAGTIATGEETIEDVGERIFRMIIDTASGRHKPWSEVYELYNDLCIFNPAPLT
jgi:galactarate dehydratase